MSRTLDKTLRIFAMLLAAVGAASINAQEDLRSLSVPYSSSNPTTIGSGIDVDLINQQRFNCLQPAEPKFLDGPGAVKTDATIELVSDYASLAKTLNLDVDYKSKGDINVGAIKAGASVDFTSKYEEFAKNESRSLAIVVKASSDFGRKGLSGYALQKDFADMLAEGKYPEFRTRCGTHTVVAQQNFAMVAIVIHLSDLTASSKRSLEATYKTSVSGSGTINGIGLSGSADKKIAWKNLVDAAQKVGRMKIEFASVGGAGVTDALKVMAIPDPARIDEVLKTISQAGETLTQANSAPIKFLLVSNGVFGLRTKVSDTSKLDALNSLYLQMVRVDSALGRIKGYSTTFPDLYAKEYATSKTLLDLRAYRKQLEVAIEACVLRDECAYTPPQALAVLFVEDVLIPESLVLNCTYKRYDSRDGKVRLNVLNDAAVVLRGTARMARFFDLQNAFLGRISPDTEPKRKTYLLWQAFSASELKPDGDGTVRVLAQMDNQKFDAAVTIGESTVLIDNEVQMIAMLNSMLNSIYTVNIQSTGGVFIQNSVGPPFGGNCPLRMPVI